MEYEYFVTYVGKGSIGRCGIIRYKKVKTTADIKEMEECINKDEEEPVLITNYKLIRRVWRWKND